MSKSCAKFTPDGIMIEKYKSLQECADKNGFDRNKWNNSFKNQIEVDGYFYKQIELNNNAEKYINTLKKRRAELKEELSNIEKVLQFHQKR